MKKFFHIISLSLLLFGCAQTEKTEAITAEITAAQLEGRRQAGQILQQELQDTAKLQQKLLEIKALQSQYIINGHPECGEAFDSAFMKTIRAVNPTLSEKLRPKISDSAGD